MTEANVMMADTVVMTVKIKVKKVHPLGQTPTYQTIGAAGCDLTSVVDLTLAPGERAAVPTGIAIELPVGYEAQARPRSGLALKHGIIMPNGPGTIDSDYRGELKVILMNAGTEPFVITPGDRIAQLVIAPVIQGEFVLVEKLSDTERGSGGFGSTGR